MGNTFALFVDKLFLENGKAFGRLKASLEKQGIGCSEPDLRIAAIAIQHDLILITGNVKHFADIPGLSVENWIEWEREGDRGRKSSSGRWWKIDLLY